MKKVLPYNYDALIESECWTYHRCAIIQAYPNLMSWFTDHLNCLTMNNKYECDFGDYGKRYNVINYYDSVLTTTEINIEEHDENDMLKFIKHCIDMDKYIIIDIDCTQVYDSITEPFVGELLIYGYSDEKNCLYTPSILMNGTIEEKICFN